MRKLFNNIQRQQYQERQLELTLLERDTQIHVLHRQICSLKRKFFVFTFLATCAFVMLVVCFINAWGSCGYHLLSSAMSPLHKPPFASLPLPHATTTIDTPVPQEVPKGKFKITVYRLRGVTASGLTVAEANTRAQAMGLDGICAVGKDTPWYKAVKTSEPAIVEVLNGAGKGRYWAVDRCPIPNVVDIWEPKKTWAYYGEVCEIFNRGDLK